MKGNLMTLDKSGSCARNGSQFHCERGEENVRVDSRPPKRERNDFLVLTDDGSIESSLKVSELTARLPPAEFGFLFVAPELRDKAKTQIDGKLKALLSEGTTDYCI